MEKIGNFCTHMVNFHRLDRIIIIPGVYVGGGGISGIIG